MNDIGMTKAFIGQTLVNVKMMIQQFLCEEQEIQISFIEEDHNYLIKYTNDDISVEERINTEQEIEELIMPYGKIVSKLIIEYVKRKLDRE